jgi:hypothetical protein
MMTHFGVSHYIIFLGGHLRNLNHVQLTKYFHNVFAYYGKA